MTRHDKAIYPKSYFSSVVCNDLHIVTLCSAGFVVHTLTKLYLEMEQLWRAAALWRFKRLLDVFHWAHLACLKVLLSLERRSGGATERVMDGLMEAGGGEKMRVQIWGGKKLFSGRVESQAWHAAHCSACFHTDTRLWLLTRLNSPMPLKSTQTHPHTLFLPLTFWLTPLFPLFIFLTLVHYILPLALLNFSYLHSLFLWPVFFFSTQPSGTEGCGGASRFP